MSRIGSYGASQMYLSRLMAIQERVNQEQLQVSTEKKSVNYTGISADANRLINLENEKAQASQYSKNNDFASTRLTAAQTALEATRKTMKQFNDRLDEFARGTPQTAAKVKEVQEWAVRAMQEMQAYLNVNIDGQYIFSGGRVSAAPVDLPTTSLADFQAMYDGSNTTFPTTRSAYMQDFSLTNSDTGTVTFNAANGAVIPANASAFNKVPNGSLVTVGGTGSNNDDVTITGHVTTNANSQPLTETASAGTTAFITTSSGNLLNAATGDLAFKFDPQGRMTITPGTANTLSTLTAGTKFTVSGSTDANLDTFNDHDGSYVVVSNVDGVVTLATDTEIATNEKVPVTSLSLKSDVVVDGVPEAVTALGLASGNVDFTVSGTTVTMTLPTGGTDLTTLYAAGDPITIGGTDSHNGTFTVGTVTANTVTFQINPDALRTSKFVPQTGRTDMDITFSGQSNPLNSTTYGSLTFSPTGTGGETITAASANAFTDVNGNIVPAKGTLITLDSTSGVNDGIYKVVSNDGTNIVIESNTVAGEASTTATFSATSWYKGDTIGLQHRIDDNVTVDVAMFASDPAFEKAFRAMGLIAQGAVGTAGGLDNNMSRLAAARYLMSDALSNPPSGSTPPYGDELVSNIEGLQSRVGITQSAIKARNEKHTQFAAFLDQRIINMENIDKTLAITMLLDDKTALEASYQTLATVRGLSLLNYMK